jgi:hypothetical protein
MTSFNSLITDVSLIVLVSRFLNLPSMLLTKSLKSLGVSPPSILLLIVVAPDEDVLLVLVIGAENVVGTTVVTPVTTVLVLDRERGVAAKGDTLPLAVDTLADLRPTPRLDPLYMASSFESLSPRFYKSYELGLKSGQGWVCKIL